MGSSQGLLITNILIAPLKDLIPTLKLCLCNWERHANDTHAYVEPTTVEFIL